MGRGRVLRRRERPRFGSRLDGLRNNTAGAGVGIAVGGEAVVLDAVWKVCKWRKFESAKFTFPFNGKKRPSAAAGGRSRRTSRTEGISEGEQRDGLCPVSPFFAAPLRGGA